MTSHKGILTHTLLREFSAIAQSVAQSAGQTLMSFYAASADNPALLETETKSDQSFVTRADKDASDLIVGALHTLTPGIPVVSEENDVSVADGKDRLFWTVDPLDGTKEFLHRTGGFCVKIALIENDFPVVGEIFSPAQATRFSCIRDEAPFYIVGSGPSLPFTPRKPPAGSPLKILYNEKHHKPAALASLFTMLASRGFAKDAVQLEGTPHLPRAMRVVATGEADAFFDCGSDANLIGGNGKSWDYAPDWLMVENAGGVVREVVSGQRPRIGHPRAALNAMVTASSPLIAARLGF